MIKLELTQDAVNFILSVLGELPTKSGAYPLAIQIKEQAEPQIQKDNSDGNS